MRYLAGAMSNSDSYVESCSSPDRHPNAEEEAHDYVLGVQGLAMVFPNQRPLYNGVNLIVREGEIIVIVGESGIGKSVFLNLLVGLLEPTSGEIWYRPPHEPGSPHVDLPIHLLSEQDMTHIRTEVGIVFQESSLFDWMTVYENIALPLEHHPEIVDSWIDRFLRFPGALCRHLSAAAQFLPPRLAAIHNLCSQGDTSAMRILQEMLEESRESVRAEVIDASVMARMAEVRLDVVADRDKLPAQLSGGMKTRVGIARTLALRPRVLLYDEPTAGLDPVMAKGIAHAILELQTEKIVSTSIVVTHDKELYWTLRDGARTRLVYLYRGQFIDESGNVINDILTLPERPRAPVRPPVHPAGGLPGHLGEERRDPLRFISEFSAKGWRDARQSGGK